MTKSELVEKIATQTSQLSKRVAEAVVEQLFESMVDALRQGERIEIRGFGSFEIRTRNAKVGRNPKTGDKVSIPQKRIPFFKAGKELRERVDS
ncbi:MAG: integration host factor subunit beta [Deltaproteobacteria bacterium]|nr:integration host factor subunit beta [Deltaproteobacteria bacterium]